MPAITFSGLSSGLDTSSWVDALVSVKQTTLTGIKSKLNAVTNKQSTVSKLQASFNSLRNAIEKLTDSKFGSAMDIFANNTAKSSNEAVFTATASKGAARQTYDINVEQLATKTSVKADHAVGAIANDSTKLSGLGITEGSMTVYVNGIKNSIHIQESDTLGDLKTRFAEAGVKTEINDKGVLTLSAQDGTSKILIGATNDTSNIKSLLGLAQQEDGTYQSTAAMYQVTTASKLTTEGIFASVDGEGNVTPATITKGTFTIGDAEFTIDDKTTISSLVSQINSNEKSGVTAYWDAVNSKMVLTSTVEGHSYINVEAGTSNFTDIMGFTNSTWSEDGEVVTTALNTDVQDLGKNAIVYINGTQVISPTNTLTGDVTKIDGVTINVKAVNTEETGATTLDISQDSSQIVSAIKTFVDEYNDVMDTLDSLTKNGGDLYGETALNSIKKSLRQVITSSTGNGDDMFKLLAEIGVSTAKAGADISADTSKLEVDEEKLKRALAQNSDAVKKVVMGTSSNQDGILSKVETIIDNALNSQGFFATVNKTIQSEMNRYNDKIKTETGRIDTYRSTLQAKFQAMEKTIASMQKSYSNFLMSS